jgi:uncharacterized protein DUF6325
MSVVDTHADTESRETIGPLGVIVIGYPPGAPMTGDAAPLLMDLVERGIIRVFDAMFVTKAEDGSVLALEAKDLDQDHVGDFAVFAGASSGLLGDEDARMAAEGLPPGSAAAVVMYENRWAAPLLAAVHRNGGVVLDAERISPEELIEVLDAAEATS